jgi:hypothetical protein
MFWIATGGGTFLILLALRDIFHTLVHPEGEGAISRSVLRATWRISRSSAGKRYLAHVSGPLALLAVVGLWALFAVLGWTLIYWPVISTDFYSASRHATDAGGTFLESLYVSMVTISTLGFGDIVPVSAWMRIVSPLEGLFGFALLTAVVSWVLQIYPALTRRRVLAVRLSLLRRAHVGAWLLDLETAPALARLLDDLSTDIVQAGVDLREYSETYYFRDVEPNASLAATLTYAVDLGRIGLTAPTSEMRLAATLLNNALEELAQVLRDRFRHEGQSMPEILGAYAADHGHSVVHSFPPTLGI